MSNADRPALVERDAAAREDSARIEKLATMARIVVSPQGGMEYPHERAPFAKKFTDVRLFIDMMPQGSFAAPPPATQEEK